MEYIKWDMGIWNIRHGICQMGIMGYKIWEVWDIRYGIYAIWRIWDKWDMAYVEGYGEEYGGRI